MGEARRETGSDRIAGIDYNDRNLAAALFCRRGGRIARRDNHVDRLRDQLIDKAGKMLGLALGGAALEFDIAALDITALGEVLSHPGAEYAALGRADRDKPDAVDLARLGKC